jgi:ABC-type lipoprotein export system ATPase subunit
VTHDKQLAAIADRTIVLRDGMVVADEYRSAVPAEDELLGMR